MARHLLERCLHLFGYVQAIPRPVHAIPFEGIDIWFVGHILGSASSIGDRVVDVQFSAECVNGYLEWYLAVS